MMPEPGWKESGGGLVIQNQFSEFFRWEAI